MPCFFKLKVMNLPCFSKLILPTPDFAEAEFHITPGK